METATMSQAEIAEYCRQRGLYPGQLTQWRGACERANDWKGTGGGGCFAGIAKKVRCDVRGRKGRLTVLEHRKECVAIISEAVQSGARLFKACEQAGIHPGTYRRWQVNGDVCEDRRSLAERPVPRNRLSDEERRQLLAVFHLPENEDLPPSQVVPKLADQGLYLASESTCYRVLHEAGQQHHRGRARPRQKRARPAEYVATAPNRVWTWDVNYSSTCI